MSQSNDTKPTDAKSTSKQPRSSKSLAVLKLLKRKQGASIEQIQKVTNWQPHSIRAALSGFRKRGIAVDRDKNAKGETIYRAAA